LKHTKGGTKDFTNIRFKTSHYYFSWLKIIREIQRFPIILEKIRKAALEGESMNHEEDDLESLGQMASGEEESE
jgi:hypothetical protein